MCTARFWNNQIIQNSLGASKAKWFFLNVASFFNCISVCKRNKTDTSYT
jgi:hypothetical protein